MTPQKEAEKAVLLAKIGITIGIISMLFNGTALLLRFFW